jgi:thiamine-monophosphate kinase
MLLHHVGELKLLSDLREKFRLSPLIRDDGIVLGIGDDAAVISLHGKAVVTTDMMLEGVHFDLGFTSAFQVGFKLVSVNVSDVMAMGARPRYVFLNFAARSDTSETFFWDFFDGVRAALDRYGVSLLGGDLSAAPHDVVCAATVIGTADHIVTRAGASVGDKIYVSGSLGDAAAGLELLKRLPDASKDDIKALTFGIAKDPGESQRRRTLPLVASAPPLEVPVEWSIAEPLVRRHLMPVARDAAGIAPYATAMIDVSDGLFVDLSRLCQESGVGARVHRESIPISDEVQRVSEILRLDAFHLASAGGEDYELLFTAPSLPDEVRADHAVPVTCIGEVVEEGMILVDRTGAKHSIEPRGYQHFGLQR